MAFYKPPIFNLTPETLENIAWDDFFPSPSPLFFVAFRTPLFNSKFLYRSVSNSDVVAGYFDTPYSFIGKFNATKLILLRRLIQDQNTDFGVYVLDSPVYFTGFYTPPILRSISRPLSVGGSGGPVLVVTVTPSNPSIPASSPLGSVVATLSAAWSDGSPFTGNFQLSSNPGNIYAVSGNKLIVNPTGPGVGSTPTIEYVTVIAVQ